MESALAELVAYQVDHAETTSPTTATMAVTMARVLEVLDSLVPFDMAFLLRWIP